ncbi:hypothetical protein J4E83_000709 [Alternaria metachromatica]|uniref:uncharacterized protein n=1 Tax=Alternaria metachromatica TaxID=283354 RepID=UPI0020C3AF0D|nr:uncharacterized protein J4E83_000709 [Alternaria metachromatica]KAI4637891.1 hypothetical protein J4E83_000709 [Alternaria metachromatica]
MSTQRQDSQHEVTRGAVSTKVVNSGSSMNLEMAYDYAKHMNSSERSAPMPDTKTLEMEQDGKPSITLTSFNCDSTSRPPVESRPLVHLFKPISEDEIRNHTTHITSTSRAEDEKAALTQLGVELNAHFQVLQREFECKRGISWTPLRPWGDEEWEWSDDGSSEGDDVFDWS